MNEWISGDPLVWDLEADHQELRVRQKLGEVRLDINAKKEPIRMHARLWRHGRLIHLAPSGIWFDRKVGQTGISELGIVGMSIELDSSNDSWHLVPDARYGQGTLVSDPDRVRRLIKGVRALMDLRAGR